MNKKNKTQLRAGEYMDRPLRDFEKKAMLEALHVFEWVPGILEGERNLVRRFRTIDEVVTWASTVLFSIVKQKEMLAFLDAMKAGVKPDLYVAILEARLVGNHCT
jgi:hypothetical protein